MNLRTDRGHVYGGERLQVEAWVLNDRPTAPEGMQLAWWVQVEGRVLFSQRTGARVPAAGARYQGTIAWQTPAVNGRTRLMVGLSLLDAHGRPVHDHTLEIEVFPRPDFSPFQGRPVAILGQEGGRAWRLAEAFGLRPASFAAHGSARVAIADHPSALGAAGPLLARFLEGGGRLLCLEQAEGEGSWPLAGRTVSWKPLDPCYFASRKAEHPISRALGPFDLAGWYHPAEKRIEPTFRHILEGEGLRHIAFTGVAPAPGAPFKTPVHLPVAAELDVSRGLVIVSAVEALARFPSEPLATGYLVTVLRFLFLDQGGL